MGNKLYVGNLAYSVRDESLQQSFSQFGTVTSAKVMMDRDTGRSKGFGFVEMGSDAEAQAAINGMNGQALEGRAIVVNEARPREERPGGFGGGGGGGSRGGGYGGGGGAVAVVAAAPTAAAAAVVAAAATAVVAVAAVVAAAATDSLDSIDCAKARSTTRAPVLRIRALCLFRASHHWRWRFLRARPDSARSKSAFGSTRSSLAIHPICQGMTR